MRITKLYLSFPAALRFRFINYFATVTDTLRQRFVSASEIDSAAPPLRPASVAYRFFRIVRLIPGSKAYDISVDRADDGGHQRAALTMMSDASCYVLNRAALQRVP